MKHVLLFGAGKSATALIHYLLTNSDRENWKLTVVDADIALIQSKLKEHPNGVARSFDIHDAEKRRAAVREADIVLSLLPPALHILVANDCLDAGKNLITASYADTAMNELKPMVAEKGLLFLCEMGLDPGIDHMSAKKILDEIQQQGGHVRSFRSHCGGLVAPESDTNPWHYKISWNPKNVVHAGKDGAVFLNQGQVKELTYEDLFKEKRFLPVQDDLYCWYPNRDSLPYISLYGLNDCQTFVRTTLRHPDFVYGWKNIVDLKLTDTTTYYDTDGKTLQDFFKEHLEKNNFGAWLENKTNEQFTTTQELLGKLMNLAELEQETISEGKKPAENLMMVNEDGQLENMNIDHLKSNAAATIAFKMHEAKLTLQQLFFLGMDDEQTFINKGRCTAADVLQFALEQKLKLKPSDHDLVVMMHEIEYERNGGLYKTESSMVLKGDDAEHTAMAKTVGLPMGIAAKMILNGTIRTTGVHIPIIKEIYEPVLSELQKYGISFQEETVKLP